MGDAVNEEGRKRSGKAFIFNTKGNGGLIYQMNSDFIGLSFVWLCSNALSSEKLKKNRLGVKIKSLFF